MFNRKEEIQHRIEMIVVCKQLIKIINLKVTANPNVSELAAEAIKGNKQTISRYLEEIRRIKRGEIKLY